MVTRITLLLLGVLALVVMNGCYVYTEPVPYRYGPRYRYYQHAPAPYYAPPRYYAPYPRRHW